jgi:hypothetical protein
MVETPQLCILVSHAPDHYKHSAANNGHWLPCFTRIWDVFDLSWFHLLDRIVLGHESSIGLGLTDVTEAAGIKTKVGNHSFRATGITAYLKNGGTLGL